MTKLALPPMAMAFALTCLPAVADSCPSSERVDSPSCVKSKIAYGWDYQNYVVNNTCAFNVRLHIETDGYNGQNQTFKRNIAAGESWDRHVSNGPDDPFVSTECCDDAAPQGSPNPKFCRKSDYRDWLEDWEVRIVNNTGHPVIARCRGNSGEYIGNTRSRTLFCQDQNDGVVWMTAASHMPVTTSYWLENDCENNYYVDIELTGGDDFGDIEFSKDTCTSMSDHPKYGD